MSLTSLAGKRGLVVGIANDMSIAAGCAQAFRAAGAELAVTYLNEKAEPFVRPVAEQLGAAMLVPLDVRIPRQMEAVFERIEREWGKLDFILIPSPSPRARICTPASSTARPKASPWRWMSPATPSSAWPGSPFR